MPSRCRGRWGQGSDSLAGGPSRKRGRLGEGWAGMALTALWFCGGCGWGTAEPETPEPARSTAGAEAEPGAAGRARKETAVKETRSGEWTPGLSEEEKATLFAIAEDTLRACVRKEGKPLSFDSYALTDKLRQPTATFVTLKIAGRLRGCIGSLAPVAPMYRSVHDNAVNAALKDFRFSPVAAEELDGIDVHISLLSPIRDIGTLDDFKLGEHGIIIEKGPYRAVYLPEVAVEQGWSREETLGSLSMKAGMPKDGWRSGARFKVFSSVSLSKGE